MDEKSIDLEGSGARNYQLIYRTPSCEKEFTDELPSTVLPVCPVLLSLGRCDGQGLPGRFGTVRAMGLLEGIFGETQFKKGTTIEAGKHSYVVIKLLGEGGFGCVYKVHRVNEPNHTYAMKVEMKNEDRAHSKLKMEIAVLQAIKDNGTKQRYFTELIDKGKKEDYTFIVMQLVGKSIKDLHTKRPSNTFTISTSCKVAIQQLQAIEDLHSVGFIHRDIKPANFAAGREPNTHIVYLLDFGMARRILTDEGKLKAPREKCKFKGTVKYASLAVHCHQEQSCKDDIESWLYMFVEMTCPEGLPWRCMDDQREVRIGKALARKMTSHFFSGLRHIEYLQQILDYVDSLKYADRVDYNFVKELMKETCTMNGGSLNDPLDWESKEKKEKNVKSHSLGPPKRVKSRSLLRRHQVQAKNEVHV